MLAPPCIRNALLIPEKNNSIEASISHRKPGPFTTRIRASVWVSGFGSVQASANTGNSEPKEPYCWDLWCVIMLLGLDF